MAWVAQDLFNQDSDGDLNGQGGGSGFSAAWTGSTVFDVTGSGTPYEGSKHILAQLEADSEVTIDRSLTTAVTAGTVYISVKIDNTAGTRRGNIYLYRGATLVGRILFTRDGASNNKIYLYDGTTFQVLDAAMANNTYYRIGIDWDEGSMSNKYRANINNGTFSSYYNTIAAISTGIDKITLSDLGNNGSGTGPIYFDTISPDYTPSDPSGPANINRGLNLMGVGQ